MSAAWAGVMAGYSARMTSQASAPPMTWAPMKLGADEGAVPAGEPGGFDAALTELSHRVGRLAPRLVAAS